MPVERLLEELLVQEVTDESDGSTENEETVKGSDLEVLGSLLLREGTGAVEEITEGGSDATVDVEDELERKEVREEEVSKNEDASRGRRARVNEQSPSWPR